jgi:hypothetical protein
MQLLEGKIVSQSVKNDLAEKINDLKKSFVK